MLPIRAIGELERVAYGVAAFVTEKAHRIFVAAAALDLHHHLLLELLQARVGEIERDGDRRHAGGGKPFVAEIAPRPEADVTCVELPEELSDASLEPGAFDRETEVAESPLEELVVGKLRPVLPRRQRLAHGALSTIVDDRLRRLSGLRQAAEVTSIVIGDTRRWRT